jgi:hypothetical protein
VRLTLVATNVQRSKDKSRTDDSIRTASFRSSVI